MLGTINFDGYDGSGWHTGAKIEARIQGTPSDGTDMPTELSFWTCPEASATLVQRMTILANGYMGFGTTTPLVPCHIVYSVPSGAAAPVPTQDVLVIDSNTYPYINFRSKSTGDNVAGGFIFSDDMRAAGGVTYKHRDGDVDVDYFQVIAAGGLVAKLSVAGLNIVGVYQVDDVQVVGNRVIDERCDDAVNSGDATTDGVIDSLRDAMITHGLIAAA